MKLILMQLKEKELIKGNYYRLKKKEGLENDKMWIF